MPNISAVMAIPNRNAGDVFRENESKNKYIKLISKNGAMWNYAEYIGTVEILTRTLEEDNRNWSFNQIEDKRPPITEWFLFSHYTLYDTAEGCIVVETEDKTQKVWMNVKKRRLYRAIRKHKPKVGDEEDILIPDELVSRLHLNLSAIRSDDAIQDIDYIRPDGFLLGNTPAPMEEEMEQYISSLNRGVQG